MMNWLQKKLGAKKPNGCSDLKEQLAEQARRRERQELLIECGKKVRGDLMEGVEIVKARLRPQ